MSEFDGFRSLKKRPGSSLKPRRRRDTWLYYTTIATLFLQAVVIAYPEVCSKSGLQDMIKNILGH